MNTEYGIGFGTGMGMLVGRAWKRGLGVAGAVVVGMALAGCAGAGGGGSSGGVVAGDTEEGVVHQVSQADLDATRSTQAVSGTSAVLWVNGLGCPQCASNVDIQLKRVRGVSSVDTDLSTGKVRVGLLGQKNPTPRDLSEAVLDAGLTLVKIEQGV